MRNCNMRHLIIYVAILIFSLPASGKKEKELVIMHTNDTHSCVMPMNPNLADTTVAGRGGYLRRVAMLREERKKNPNLLYFDSGDFSQGSAYYTMFRGEVEVGLMNMMGVTAATLGNHEWDYGLDNLAERLRQANFPIICTNCDFSDTPLEGLVKPYIVIKRNGLKIGIFALATKLEGLVDKKNYGNIKYIDPVSCAMQTATMLREEKKCDVIICISHLGWSENGDIAMIKGSRNIDLVLGGHTHSRFRSLEYADNIDGVSVPVDQNGKAGINVSRIVLKVK